MDEWKRNGYKERIIERGEDTLGYSLDEFERIIEILEHTLGYQLDEDELDFLSESDVEELIAKYTSQIIRDFEGRYGPYFTESILQKASYDYLKDYSISSRLMFAKEASKLARIEMEMKE